MEILKFIWKVYFRELIVDFFLQIVADFFIMTSCLVIYVSNTWGGHRQNEKATICRFCRIFCRFLGTDKKLQKSIWKATTCRFFVAFFVGFFDFFRSIYGF